MHNVNLAVQNTKLVIDPTKIIFQNEITWKLRFGFSETTNI